MSLYKLIFRRFLFWPDPEWIHDRLISVLRKIPVLPTSYPSNLGSSVGGVRFPSPVGLAAGFDKDAKVFTKMYAFGFASVEVGTLTPRIQDGNPKPRIHRIAKHNAVINAMGFPNAGLDSAVGRLASFASRPGPLGVNIGANKDSEDKIADYVTAYRQIADIADYATINVSSPNTPGLRNLETGEALRHLLNRMDKEIDCLKTPVFLKVSPDLSIDQIKDACAAILSSKISAVIVGNTTLQRPTEIAEVSQATGGLSGEPLRKISETALSAFYGCLKGKMPIISVGGIASVDDAYSRILSGASLVQLYTGFIYEGPFLIKAMNAGLSRRLAEDGFESLSDAIGAGVGSKPNQKTGAAVSHSPLPEITDSLALA